jgi:hypothetical protein
LALGAIGGEAAVLGLADRWPGEGEELQRDIVAAWAMPASFAAGGEAQLVRAAELSSGTAALSAAAILSERRAGPPGLADQILVNAIREGSRDDRRLAIRVAPLSPPVLLAVQEASRSAPPVVRVTALARLLNPDAPAPETLASLRQLAREADSEVAVPARAALAGGRDQSVKPWLEQDLKAPRASRRRLAAFGLIRLGDFANAAYALSDDSPSVRTRVACRILATR